MSSGVDNEPGAGAGAKAGGAPRMQRGSTHAAAGGAAQAERGYRDVLEADPENAAALHGLGMLRFRAGDFDAAAAYLQRAVISDSERASYHLDLGRTLQHLNRIDEAVAAVRHALDLDPGDPDAHLAHAGICVDAGDFAEAEAAYRRVIDKRSRSGAAWYGLALIKHFEHGDADIDAMAAALAAGPLEAREQSNLLFALGRAHDHLGDYDTAFGYLREANRIKRQLVPFDMQAEVRNTERIIDAFTPAVFEKFRGAGDPSQVPVFILGMPRSGSTLVEQILASHPGVHGGGELNDLWRTVVGIGAFLPAGLGLPEGVGAVRAEGWQEIGSRYVEAIRRYAPGAERITDKLPFNYTLAGIIHLMLPRARIINCVRDPLDTCLSCYMISFGGDRGFTNDLGELGLTYRLYERLMQHWHQVMPGVILDVMYEELTADVESHARRIVQHVGLEWSAQCLEFHTNTRPVATASYAQVRQPIYRSSVGRWKRYEKYLGALQGALGRPLDRGTREA